MEFPLCLRRFSRRFRRPCPLAHCPLDHTIGSVYVLFMCCAVWRVTRRSSPDHPTICKRQHFNPYRFLVTNPGNRAWKHEDLIMHRICKPGSPRTPPFPHTETPRARHAAGPLKPMGPSTIYGSAGLGPVSNIPSMRSASHVDLGYERTAGRSVLGDLYPAHHSPPAFYDDGCAAACSCEPGRRSVHSTPFGRSCFDRIA